MYPDCVECLAVPGSQIIRGEPMNVRRQAVDDRFKVCQGLVSTDDRIE
jgi:hypothetical protein